MRHSFRLRLIPAASLAILIAVGASCVQSPPMAASAPVFPRYVDAGLWEPPPTLRDDPSLSPAERARRRGERNQWLRSLRVRLRGDWIANETVPNAPGAESVDVLKDRRPRVEWFERAQMGMFICFIPGHYTEGEMGFIRGRMKKEDWPAVARKWKLPLDLSQSPVEIYDSLPKHFNPTDFDASEVVGMARKMGAQYIVFVAKHHDGFSMFRTAQSDYNVMNTPYGRDVTKMLADEAHRQGLKLGIYYSLADWYRPDFKSDFPAYLKFMYAQFDELLTQYGKVDVFWYDGGGGKPWPYRDMAKLIRWRQPDCIIRAGAFYQQRWPAACDYTASEFGIPPIPHRKFTGRQSFEWCFNLMGQWGYTSKPRRLRPASDVIHRQIKAVGRGGNVIVSLDPSPTGGIDKHYRQVFDAVAAWNAKYGHTLLDTLAGPTDFNPYGHATVKGRNLYLFLTTPPAGDPDVTVPLYGLRSPIRRVVIEGGKTELPVEGKGELRRVALPADQMDSPFAVLRVELNGKLDVSDIVYARPGSSALTLLPYRASLQGKQMRFSIPHKSVIGWAGPTDRMEWSFHVSEPGEYEVTAQYGCPAKEGGSELVLSCEGQALSLVVQGVDRKLLKPTLGVLRFGKPGVYRLALKARRLMPGGVIQLRYLKLSRLISGGAEKENGT